jgi:hypothetical protein
MADRPRTEPTPLYSDYEIWVENATRQVPLFLSINLIVLFFVCPWSTARRFIGVTRVLGLDNKPWAGFNLPVDPIPLVMRAQRTAATKYWKGE